VLCDNKELQQSIDEIEIRRHGEKVLVGTGVAIDEVARARRLSMPSDVLPGQYHRKENGQRYQFCSIVLLLPL